MHSQGVSVDKVINEKYYFLTVIKLQFGRRG